MRPSATLIILLLLSVTVAHGAPTYTVRDLSLVIYGDGTVRVKEGVDVTTPEFTLQTFGKIITDVLAKNEKGDVLGYRYSDGALTVTTGGAATVSVSYTTPDLTSKDGYRWTISFDSPVQVDIRLPDSSTLVNFDPLPNGISNVGDTTSVMMPAGKVLVAYYIGIVGTKGHALAVITDLDETMKTLRAQGLILTPVEAIYNQATQAYSRGEYVEAETAALRAKDAATQLKTLMDGAVATMASAEKSIENARAVGRTVGLTVASNRLGEAKSSYAVGSYSQALTQAVEAKESADTAVAPQDPYQTYMPILLLLVSGSVIGGYLLLRRKPEVEPSTAVADLDLLRSEHPEVRDDDSPVLNYIAGHPGGVFMSQLRDQFSMPRSTAWRTVTRLEEMGVIETERVGRETFIRLDGRYLRGEPGKN